MIVGIIVLAGAALALELLARGHELAADLDEDRSL